MSSSLPNNLCAQLFTKQVGKTDNIGILLLLDYLTYKLTQPYLNLVGNILVPQSCASKTQSSHTALVKTCLRFLNFQQEIIFNKSEKKKTVSTQQSPLDTRYFEVNAGSINWINLYTTTTSVSGHSPVLLQLTACSCLLSPSLEVNRILFIVALCCNPWRQQVTYYFSGYRVLCINFHEVLFHKKVKFGGMSNSG